MELAGGLTTMEAIRGGRADVVVSCVHRLVVGFGTSDSNVSPPHQLAHISTGVYTEFAQLYQ